MAIEPNKVIYSMVGVGKNYDKRAVLKDIYLSYFYGAKIGVIGLNGSGKSSLLRIMAGVDKEFNSEAVLSPTRAQCAKSSRKRCKKRSIC
jgi:energy-dependent translational throttle protein EttA